MATVAFQHLGQAIDAIRKYLELPASDGHIRGRRPNTRAPAKVVDVHPMLKALLTEGTLKALDAVLKEHAELGSASSKVRTATSTHMKSSSDDLQGLLHSLRRSPVSDVSGICHSCLLPGSGNFEAWKGICTQ